MSQSHTPHPDAGLGEVLAEIVEAASGVILPFWKSELEVVQKADSSPVTEADRAGERLILRLLAERFPGMHVVSEEHASEFGTPDEVGERFALVDPVDGTKAFVRGDPNFSVYIGIIDRGRPIAGAVCAPATGEIWMTTAEGAMKRRVGSAVLEPVRARPWPQGEAIALVSHTMKEETAAKLAARYGFTHRQAMDSSIKLVRIAEGAADIYPRHGPTSEWDIAAGHAVLEAAGGALTTPEGEPLVYGKAPERFLNRWFVARGA